MITLSVMIIVQGIALFLILCNRIAIRHLNARLDMWKESIAEATWKIREATSHQEGDQ